MQIRAFFLASDYMVLILVSSTLFVFFAQAPLSAKRARLKSCAKNLALITLNGVMRHSPTRVVRRKRTLYRKQAAVCFQL